MPVIAGALVLFASGCMLLSSPPIATAGKDQQIGVGEQATLNGSASIDPDFEPLSFVWTITSAPANLAPTQYRLTNTTQALASFSSDAPGVFIITLTVSDSYGSSDGTLKVTVLGPDNSAPAVTIREGDQTVDSGVAATFTAEASDPDAGDTLAYQWSVDGTPLPGQTATTFEFSAPPAVQTLYTISVEVTDIGGLTATAAATLTGGTSANDPPAVTIGEGDQAVDSGVVATFTASVTDPDSGDTFSYQWFVNAMPQVGVTGATFTFSDTPPTLTEYGIAVLVRSSRGSCRRQSLQFLAVVGISMAYGGSSSCICTHVNGK